MNTAELPAAVAQPPAKTAKGLPVKAEAAAAEEFYLAFRLAGEVYAIDILRIREIIEYTVPTAIPMMPSSVRGVINLRGSVVPVIDLAIRFGREATGVGRRTCIVIVEVEHEGALLVLGLMVDGVNAVMEIAAESIEPPPAFGTRVDVDFIEGMAKTGGRFVIILNLARVLSIAEIAAVKSVDRSPLTV